MASRWRCSNRLVGVVVVEIPSFKKISLIDEPGRTPNLICQGMKYSADDSTLACSFTEGAKATLRIYDVKTGKLQREILMTELTGPRRFSLSPDGGKMAVLADEKQLSMYDTRNGKPARLIPLEFPNSIDAVFTLDAKSLVVSGVGNIVAIIDAESGKEIKRLPARAGIFKLLFATDGDSLIGAGDAARDGVLEEPPQGAGGQTQPSDFVGNPDAEGPSAAGPPLAVAARDPPSADRFSLGAGVVKPVQEAMPNKRAGGLAVRARGQLEPLDKRSPLVLAVKEPSFVVHVRPTPPGNSLKVSRSKRAG